MMHSFAYDLEKSLKEGKPMGNVKQHFTLFKEMPTICSILVKSFELEERTILAKNKMKHRNY